MVEFHAIDLLALSNLEPLLKASLAEGYPFIDRLWEEYRSGQTRFETPGVLLGAFDEGAMAGIGGIHTDSYLNRNDVARVRHVYVLPEYQRAGVGRRLMHDLVEHARHHFRYVTLRTPTAHGDLFYAALGFSREPQFDHATHWLKLK